MYRRVVFGSFVFSAMIFGGWSAERKADNPMGYYKPWPQNKLMSEAMVKFPPLARLLGYGTKPAPTIPVFAF